MGRLCVSDSWSDIIFLKTLSLSSLSQAGYVYNIDMKRTLTIVAGIILVIAACSRKMIPAATKAEQPTSQSASSEETTIAAGKVLYESRCSRCHGLPEVDKWSATQWEPIMESMAPKAKLTDVEKQQVTAYVNANAKK